MGAKKEKKMAFLKFARVEMPILLKNKCYKTTFLNFSLFPHGEMVADFFLGAVSLEEIWLGT